MHSIDPTNFSQAEPPSVLPEHSEIAGGWTCHVGDGLSATDFTYENGQLVDVHHSGFDAHQNFDGLQDLDSLQNLDSFASHESYTDLTESYSQGLDLSSHHFANLDMAQGLDQTGFDGNLSTHDFTPQALPRSGTDYATAADHEGWAKHYDGMADSWASGGYLDKAADYQKQADAERQKAGEA